MSKKRLLAIINNTKCPTDTESSDSDIEKIEGLFIFLDLCGLLIDFLQSTFPWKRSAQILEKKLVEKRTSKRLKKMLKRMERKPQKVSFNPISSLLDLNFLVYFR